MNGTTSELVSMAKEAVKEGKRVAYVVIEGC